MSQLESQKPSETNTAKFGSFTFTRAVITTLDGKKEIRYTENAPGLNAFSFVVTQQGVKVMGDLSKPLSTPRDVDGFSAMFALAWKEHMAMVPQIVTSPSGH